MTRISNTDQVLLLIRQQLQRLSESKTGRRTAKTSGIGPAPQATMARLKALGQLQDTNAEDFKRPFIQGLLIDEFGEGLINDPRFQKMVDRIIDIISRDPDSRELLAKARSQLLD